MKGNTVTRGEGPPPTLGWMDDTPSVPLRPARPRRWPSRSAAAAIVILLALSAFMTVRVTQLRHSTGHLSAQVRRQSAALARTSQQLGHIQQLLRTQSALLAQARREIHDSERLPSSALVVQIRRSVVTVVAGESQGSGFAVRVAKLPGGYRSAILTDAHVIRSALHGHAGVFVLSGAIEERAHIAEWSEEHDVALLYIHASIPALTVADPSRALEPGDIVIAVGSPYLLSGTVTEGIVSRLNADTIQTDVSVNPGNSGGPLTDSLGQVIGIVASRIWPAQGIGFAIPIHVVCDEFLVCP